MLGIRSSRNPSSGIPADHGGAAPSQTAQLLLLHCFTAGVGGRNLVVIFFLKLFLTDPLIPSYKVLGGTQGKESKKRVLSYEVVKCPQS